jgi:hypothetical protein
MFDINNYERKSDYIFYSEYLTDKRTTLKNTRTFNI